MANDKQPPKIDSEQVRRNKEEQARAARRRSRQMIGVALSVLIVVGALSIVNMGVDLVRGLMDDSELKDEYARRIETMVWFDVLPFSDPAQADQNSLKQTVLWSIFYDQQTTLERDEIGSVLIPAIEVDIYAANLFGPSFRFGEHESFYEPSQAMEYTYSPEAQAYTIMVTSPTILFQPKVVEIERESGGVRRVVVGYVSNQSGNEIVPTPDYDNPVRYMDYLFRRDGNEYYLFAVERNTSMPTPQPSSSSSAPTAPSDEPDSSEDEDAVPSGTSTSPPDSGDEPGGDDLPGGGETPGDGGALDDVA